MRGRLLLPRVGEECDDARDSILHHSRRAFGLVLPCVHDRPDKTHSQNDGPSGCCRSCVVQTDNMPKKMLIDATHAEETRVVVVDGNKVEEFDFESENRRQIAGNIYLAKVTRVEPSLQAAFVDYGGNRHGFLAFSEIHPDYYQIPVADREALIEEERAYAEAQKAREDEDDKPKKPRRSRSRTRAAEVSSDDAVISTEVEIDGMETIDLSADDAVEGLDAETVTDVPVVEAEAVAVEVAEETVVEAVVEEATFEDTTSEEPAVEATEDPTMGGEADDAEGEDSKGSNASSKDDSIESVADEDDRDDIRPVRKPRARRYKIQEVIKVRQILLIQVVKEERGNKGAALTTYLSLAGRYCVLMPNTARGGGISRKITNAADRKKLKEIANEIEVPEGAGLIVRTAGAKRAKAEIMRDYEYLQRMWEQIRELTLKSIAPAKIYEEGDLIKRSIRDLYNGEIDEVFVEGERGYRIAKDFMKMIMPSHAKNVKRYEDTLPLFARFQVESYLSGMFNPTVQLKSGGYIVIGITEALVAVDVNSGRSTKEGSIEDTAVKTNLEAAEEVARQLRLRDLAGLIVIDFIDMDERKNNAAVEKRMKDKLKTDRARIQVSRISGFGLMEMSRQRLRPGMIEATTQPCPSCHGTGLIRSDDNLGLSILRQIEEEGTRRRTREVLVRCPVGIANFLMNQKRDHIAHIEVRYGMSVCIEADPSLVTPDFTIEKFKTATRALPVAHAAFVAPDTSVMDKIDEADALAADVAAAADIAADAGEVVFTIDQSVVAPVATDEDGEGKPKRRRRRRRRRKSNGDEAAANGENVEEGASNDAAAPAVAAEDDANVEASAEAVSEETVAEDAPVAEAAEEKPAKPKRKRALRAKIVKEEASTDEAVATEAAAEAPSKEAVATEEEPKPKPKRVRKSRAKVKVAVVEEAQESAPETVVAAPVVEAPAPVAEPVPAPAPVAEVAPQEPAKPKRRGWWSLGK